MSHFGIDPRAAKDFWNEETMEPFSFDWEKVDEDMAAAIIHNQRVCEAFLFGRFPSAEEAKTNISMWAEFQDIARKHPVEFLQPKKMPDVGTMGKPDEPFLNELTRLIRGGLASDEVSVVIGKPTTAYSLRPEVMQVYKSRRRNPVLHVALEDTKSYLVERYLGTSI